MSTDTNSPTPREELQRKTVEHLQWLEEHRVAGSLDADYISAAAATVWAVTTGLIDSDISHLVAQFSSDASRRAGRRIFVGRGRVLVLQVGFVKGFRVMEVNTATGETGVLVDSDLDVGERDEPIQKLTDRLAAGGLVEI